MKYVLLTLAVLACVSAVAAIVRAIISSEKTQNSAFVILPISGHMEDIELRVRELIRKSRALRGAAIILADFGADAETAEICRRMCREFNTVRSMNGKELEGTLCEQANQKNR